MTAPTVDAPTLDGQEPLDRTETAPAERPEGTAPVRLVLAVEGIDTSDGRFINQGALSTRPMPLTLYAQVRSTHGLEGDAATWVVGAITEAERVPGPTVVQRSTGQPFPEDTSVWMGKGWMYTDVPTPESGSKPAYTLMKDGALYGNSVDLSAVDAEFQYAEDQQPGDGAPERIVMHAGVISSTTIVGIPAFMDSFVEVDGEAITASATALQALAASAERIPSWRSVDVGDVCVPCAAGDSTSVGPAADLLTGEDLDPDALDFSTSGMVALIPDNAQMLAVPGGLPGPELHLTLAYLGAEVDTWGPEQIAAVHRTALEFTDRDAQIAREDAERLARGEEPQPSADVRGYEGPGQRGPLTMTVFAHAVFNPNGHDDQDSATVYLFEGGQDRTLVDELAGSTQYAMRDVLGTVEFPEQHYPFVPHVTAGYNLSADQLTYTGPVTFDRLRVALGRSITDYPLGGGRPAMVASAAPPAPLAWFQDPELDGPTALTVTDDGRVYGHLACWGTCHIGFQGKCVTPPRSNSSYAYFAVHSTRAIDDNGNIVDVPVGYGTIGTGHADIRADALAAAEHYDNTGTAAFELAIGEDDWGIWVAGRLMPGLDELTEHKARGTVFSGDWRTIRGGLELVASLGVNTPGFPVPRTRVASGQPFALVAAGMVTARPDLEVMPDVAMTRRDLADLRTATAWINEQRVGAARTRVLAELACLTEGADPSGLQAGLVADLEQITGDPFGASE